MSDSSVWATVIVAITTGTFTIAAQIFSARSSRISQKLALEEQRGDKERDKKIALTEEMYSLAAWYFDLTHTAVIKFKSIKSGIATEKELLKFLDHKGDYNEKYLRMMMLLTLYFSDILEEFNVCSKSLRMCQHILFEWKNNTAKDISDGLDEQFQTAKSSYKALTTALSQHVNQATS